MLWAAPYFLLSVAGHAVLRRAFVRLNSVSGFLVVGVAAGAALAIHEWLAYGVGVAALAALAAYACACELYLFLFTLVGTSISVRLLLTLRDGERTEQELAAMYRPSDMVARRIQRLHAVGLLDTEETVSLRGRRLLRTFGRLRGFFGLPELISQQRRFPRGKITAHSALPQT